MDLGLTDKVALVTGASRGIGNRIALATEGTRPIVCARTGEAPEAAAVQMAALGAEVETLLVDVTEPDSGEQLVTRAMEHFGGLDVLVNNVDGSVWTPFEQISDDEWLLVLNLSFLTAGRGSRAALISMMANPTWRGKPRPCRSASTPLPRDPSCFQVAVGSAVRNRIRKA